MSGKYRIYIVCTSNERWFYREGCHPSVIPRQQEATRYTYYEALRKANELNEHSTEQWVGRVCIARRR